MADLLTLYRCVLHLASCLLVVGLVVSISPVLAESVNEPSSKGLSPCEAEVGKGIVKAEEIIKALGEEGDEIDCSGCIVEGDLDFFTLRKENFSLFSWDDIPGNDSKRLIGFLEKDLEINWAKNATIKKAEGNKTINVSEGKNLVTLKLNKEGNNVTLNISNGKTYEYVLKEENGKLNIYKQVIIIKRPLKFRKTVFKGNIGTWNQSMELEKQPPVKFLSKVDFVGVCFEDHVSLDGAIFVEDAKFGGAHFHKMASFTEATFNKSAGFRSAQFDERALFRKTVFEGRTDFAVATFNGITFFDKSKFRYIDDDENKSWRGANFLFTKFNGLFTYFSEAQFNSTARFIGTNFHGPTYFFRSTFENQAWFAGGCRFDDDVSFKGAKFLKKGSSTREKQGNAPRAPVLFSGVVFSGNAIFSDVQFNQVSFCEIGTGGDLGMDTIFRKKADFRGAKFETLELQRVIFESNVDFSNADFGERVDFTNVDIERASILLEWEQLLNDSKKPTKIEWKDAFKNGEYQKGDKQSGDAFVNFLSLLERKFQERGQLKDAAEVHFLVEDTKRKRRLESEDFKDKIYYGLDTFFLKWIYGYGVKYRRHVLASLISIFGFAFVYMPRNVLRYDQTRDRKTHWPFTSIPIDGFYEKKVPADSTSKITQLKSSIYRFWQGFRFSFYVFTKIGYGGVYVRGRYYRLAVKIEWVLGFVLGALLLINLANRWEPLYRLVSMLF